MCSSRERVIAAFNGENQGYVPVAPFLGGSWPIIYEGYTLKDLIGNAKKTAEIFYKVNEALDIDLVTVGAGSTALMIKALGGEVHFTSHGAPSIIGELIKTDEDIERLKSKNIWEDTDMKWIKATSKHLYGLIDDKRMVLASGRAPFTLASQLYGVENLMRAMYKKKDFVHRLLEYTTSLSIAYFKSMIEDNVSHGAFIADPTSSGDLLSKRHFEEFCLPYLKQIVRAIKAKDKPIMLHICGNITDRLGLLADTGIDCLSLDAKVDLTRAREIVKDKICLAGNINPVDVLEAGTTEDVIENTYACIKAGNKNGGFILMPGCDFSYAVSFEKVKAMVETAHKSALYLK